VANVKVPAVFQVEFKATSKIPFVETVRAEMVPVPPMIPFEVTATGLTNDPFTRKVASL
jgi:hypothetical protein